MAQSEFEQLLLAVDKIAEEDHAKRLSQQRESEYPWVPGGNVIVFAILAQPYDHLSASHPVSPINPATM